MVRAEICLDTEGGAKVGWPMTEMATGTVAEGLPTTEGRWKQGLTGFNLESQTEILIAQRVRRNRRPSFKSTTYVLGSGKSTLTTPGNHLFLIRARTVWPTDNADERTSTERGWINAALCWRHTNSSRTTEAGTNMDLSDDESTWKDDERDRQWTGYRGRADCNEHFPEGFYIRKHFEKHILHCLDVTFNKPMRLSMCWFSCNTPVTRHFRNWVPLSDSNSSVCPKSQKNLYISSINTADVMDLSETTHGFLLYESTCRR